MRPPVETKRGAPVVALVLVAILGGAIVQSPRIAEGGGSYCHDDYWLLNQLSEGAGFKGLSGGDFIAVPLEYALNSTADSYSDTDTVSTTRVDVFDRAEFQWKENIVSVVISDLEADRNAGEGQVFGLLAAKLENARNSARSELNSQLFSDGTGNTGKDIGGLQLVVDVTPSTTVCGGIDPASFSFWRNQQASGAQTSSAYDNLRAVMRTVYNQSSLGVASDHPSFAVTTRTIFEGYEGLLLANERFTDKTSGEGSFKNEVLKFKGCKISYDNDCLASTLYFLNPKYLKLAYKKGSWMKMRPPVKPANQTIDVYLIRTMANLITTNRRKLGVVSAIT